MKHHSFTPMIDFENTALSVKTKIWSYDIIKLQTNGRMFENINRRIGQWKTAN